MFVHVSLCRFYELKLEIWRLLLYGKKGSAGAGIFRIRVDFGKQWPIGGVVEDTSYTKISMKKSVTDQAEIWCTRTQEHRKSVGGSYKARLVFYQELRPRKDSDTKHKWTEEMWGYRDLPRGFYDFSPEILTRDLDRSCGEDHPCTFLFIFIFPIISSRNKYSHIYLYPAIIP